MIDYRKFKKVFQDQFRVYNGVRYPYRNIYACCLKCGEDHFVKEAERKDSRFKWNKADEMHVNGHVVKECVACAAREDPPRILY